MTYQQIIKDIEKGNIAPIYVFYGTESYLLQEMVSYMERKLVDPESRDFNYSTYDLRETPIELVLQDAETFPFMADRRLVVGKDALFLTGARVSSSVEHNGDALIAYAENPPEYSTLVLVVPQEKLDERKNIVKKLKSQAVTAVFQPLQGNELEAWVVRRAKHYHVSLAPGVPTLLVAMVGQDLALLNQELKKMSQYTGSGGTITVDTVELLASRSLEQDIFALVDRVARVKLDEAFRILYDLLQNKEEPIKILNLLARQFRLILQAKLLSNRGYGQKQIASQLKVHPYAVKLALEQGGHFSEKALREILSTLADEDFRMKSGQTDKVLALEMFLLKLKEWVA